MERLREMMANADLRDDDELLALAEARIEGENILTITSKPLLSMQALTTYAR